MSTDPRIPMSSPDLSVSEVEAVTQVLSTRTLSIGPHLEAFERAVAVRACGGVDGEVGA